MRNKVKAKVITKEKKQHYCYFCGRVAREQHHIIFKEFLGKKGLENNKVWICKKCHKKFHKLAQPVVDLLMWTIQKFRPKEMKKIGYVRTNHKGGKK